MKRSLMNWFRLQTNSLQRLRINQLMTFKKVAEKSSNFDRGKIQIKKIVQIIRKRKKTMKKKKREKKIKKKIKRKKNSYMTLSKRMNALYANSAFQELFILF